MNMISSSFTNYTPPSDVSLDNTQDAETPSGHFSKTSKRSVKDKDRLIDVAAVLPDALIKIPRLAVDAAVGHIKDPISDFGHKTVSSKRALSDLGDSIFSVLFQTPKNTSLKQPPEQDRHFMSLIEEIEKYMYEVIAIPNNENEMHEDMRKHKKFIQESMDELEFLEKYFGVVKLSESAIINFKKFRPVDLALDASAERY